MAREKSVAEELLALAKKLLDDSCSVKRSKDDDDYDAGYKDGGRKALNDAVWMIYVRVEELQKRSEKDG